MDIYLPPSLYRDANYHVFSTWTDHVPFGYDIVSAIKPKITVELGTYAGMSFFIFCQALQENDIDGVAYAVDTWAGDEHTGEYGNSIYDQVDKHARDNYRGISYLLQTTFDEAVTNFDDNSIDLLHIDGLHTYDAVKNDFETWYPKVAPGGIILFHDIEARREGFGVRQFWAELEQSHTTFKFFHGYGLGVLQKPGGTRPLSELETLLFSGNEQAHHNLRKLYAHISHHHDTVRRVKFFESRIKPKGNS